MSVVDIATIEAAEQSIHDARADYRKLVKEAINAEVGKLLKQPGIDVVSWAQKSSEYNDEGMYPGVAGPVINSPFVSDDGRAWDRNYGVLYQNVKSPEASALSVLLDKIDCDELAEIFGDECSVDARLIPGTDQIEYETEYAGV